MEDFVALPDLVPRDKLHALSQKSDAPGIARLTQHLGALTLTGAGILYLADTLWVWPAMVVHGILLVFLFCPLHEAAHGTAFRSRWLNNRTGDVAGFLTLYPRLMYRVYHFAHHRHTQDPERDPELALKKPETYREYAVWVSGWRYWTSKGRTVLRYAFTGEAKAPFIPKQMEKKLVRESRLVLLGYAAIAVIAALTDPMIVLMLWIGPALLGQPFLRAYLLTEHTGCSNGPNMLENVRTILAGPVVRWLAWNMPYHTEHHVFPSIPFHALPAAHREISDSLIHVSPSHAGFNASLLQSFAPGGAKAHS
jgi:fatty acid desaturase